MIKSDNILINALSYAHFTELISRYRHTIRAASYATFVPVVAQFRTQRFMVYTFNY